MLSGGWTCAAAVTLILSALVVLRYGRDDGTTHRNISHVNCTSHDERAVCVVHNVCVDTIRTRSGEKSYQLFGFQLNDDVKLIAYLIATDLFPQSAIYLQPISKRSKTEQDAGSFAFDDVTTYMFTRFKPDNIMHVLHDDLLPLYASLRLILGTGDFPYNVRLLFADSFDVMPYDSLYRRLALHSLDTITDFKCYKRLLVGADKSTLWYQYGFAKFQGPMDHDPKLIKGLIDEFAIRTRKEVHGMSRQIVLFSRHYTRRILNEDELSFRLARNLSTSVKTVGLETHSLEEVIAEVSKACMVIGMHGSLLSTIIWLPANSTVVELFPYAVRPESYTPYKTLAHIEGLSYLAWENRSKNSSVGHPEYPPEDGGLEHLDESEKNTIMDQDSVPPHLCCDDPSWLYHINQDTEVNEDELVKLLYDRKVSKSYDGLKAGPSNARV